MKFQFALPRGERQAVDYGADDLTIVSIRAPAWGATQVFNQVALIPLFQFALPRGERPESIATFAIDTQFQFALPRGERLFISLENND